MCALGATIADYKSSHIRSMRGPLTGFAATDLQKCFGELEDEGRDRLAAESERIEGLQVVRSADMRYRGQAFDVEVMLPVETDPGQIDAEYLAAKFHETYEALYRNSDPASAIELVALRVVVVGRRPRPELPRLGERPAAGGEPEFSKRRIFHGGQFHEASIYQRGELLAGDVISGPAIIEQFDTTTLVAPGFAASCDQAGNLLLSQGS